MIPTLPSELARKKQLQCATDSTVLTKPEQELLKELNAIHGAFPSSLNENANQAPETIAAA